MKTNKMILVVGACLLLASACYAEETEKSQLLYATESGLGIQFSGEVEMEFVNVEGKGGFSNQDLTVQKVKNRSPYMGIDKAILETKVVYSEDLYYKIQFRMGDDGTRVDKHYARLSAPSLNTVFELGKNRPMIARDRLTEGYSLLGTTFWKGREYHVTSQTDLVSKDDFKVTGGLSFAMQRPLGTDDAAEDKSFNMLVYDDYDVKNGQTFEYGGQLGVEAGPLSASGWYYTGELIDDFDWKIQLSQNLQSYDDLGDETDLTHYWYGGRAGLDIDNLHAVAEYIRSKDGLLPRVGYSAEVSLEIQVEDIPLVSDILSAKSIVPLVRHGVLNVEKHPEHLGNSNTWDRTMTTIALLTHINDFLHVKIEYYILDEETGGVAPDDKVRDNQFVAQLNLQF